MEQRLISFRKLKFYCNRGEQPDCAYIEDDTPCTAKNCPVWRKLKSLEEATIFPKVSSLW